MEDDDVVPPPPNAVPQPASLAEPAGWLPDPTGPRPGGKHLTGPSVLLSAGGRLWVGTFWCGGGIHGPFGDVTHPRQRPRGSPRRRP